MVGAGYTGTEVAAQGVLYTDVLHARHPRLRARPRWLLLDLAERILPELDPRLSRTADAVLRARGVDVRTGVSVREATPDGVALTDGEVVPTRSLIWCVGVRPDPLVDELGLKTERGRLMVDEYLTVPGHPEVYAAGDAAAVPDLTRPGELTPMTAQHAQRQGERAAYNIAASYGRGRRRPYKHHDLGFVVDLGGTQAAADPVGCPWPACRPRWLPADTTCWLCPATAPAPAPIGCSTPSCPARSCSWAWCPRWPYGSTAPPPRTMLLFADGSGGSHERLRRAVAAARPARRRVGGRRRPRSGRSGHVRKGPVASRHRAMAVRPRPHLPGLRRALAPDAAITAARIG